jgi:preprotein translocase subunit SecF
MNYKKMALTPLSLLIICAIYLVYTLGTSSLLLDIDLKGGTQIIADYSRQISDSELESILRQYDANVRSARGITIYTVFIEFDASIKPEDVLKTLKQNGYDFTDYSVQTIGPALGSSFLQQAAVVLIFSFIFMAATIFFIYRIPLPSLFLVLNVIADLTETLVFSQIFGIKLSLAAFASLLLLIGYSVDDNILMATRVLRESEKKEKNYDAIIKRSFKTGMTMVGTTVVALFALFIISTSVVIDTIASVLIIGLLLDLVNSWILNVGFMMWYVDRKERKAK